MTALVERIGVAVVALKEARFERKITHADYCMLLGELAAACLEQGEYTALTQHRTKRYTSDASKAACVAEYDTLVLIGAKKWGLPSLLARKYKVTQKTVASWIKQSEALCR